MAPYCAPSEALRPHAAINELVLQLTRFLPMSPLSARRFNRSSEAIYHRHATAFLIASRAMPMGRKTFDVLVN
jgi:hypothetical protein